MPSSELSSNCMVYGDGKVALAFGFGGMSIGFDSVVRRGILPKLCRRSLRLCNAAAPAAAIRYEILFAMSLSLLVLVGSCWLNGC